MGITVGEAMKIYPFSLAKLLGGAGGLGREVESANIQEVPHVERWLHAKEILFSAGYAFQGLEDGVGEMMERIKAVGAAALVLKPGQFLREIPQAWIDQANRIDLPLFCLPEGLPYMDCILPILERITQKQLFQLRRVESIHEQLTRSILRREGLEGICRTLREVTGQPVFIFTPAAGAVLASALGEGEEAYGVLLQTLFERCCRPDAAPRLRTNQCNTLSLDEGHTAICVPIVVQEERLAYLLLDCTDCGLPDIDLIAFEHASSLIAVELLKEQALVEQEQKIREKLLEDLLMRRYGDMAMLHRRGLSVGIDLEKPYCVFILDPDGFEDYVRREQGGLSEVEIQQLKGRIHGIIREGLRSFRGPQLLLSNSVSMVGMISVLRKEDRDSCRSVLEGIIRELGAQFPKLGFFAGIGRVKADIRQADASHREARLALSCGRLPQFHPEDSVTCFEDLGALSFLSELSQSQTMREYYDEHIGGLIAYDEAHNAELISTLECYFRCGQNLRLTSERLFIHKNSVIYRLHKVEALLGITLSDSGAAFNLQLCLLLRNLF